MRPKLIEAREARGLNQEQVAEMIGRTRSAYTKYELGIIDIPGTMLQKLSQVLGISIEDILFEAPIEANSHV